MNRPEVFISSTLEDLRDYRDKAESAVNKAGCHPITMKYFTADGKKPYDTCMNKVKPCDVLVVIVAHRCGWIPEDQPQAVEQKSITWLECEQAERDGKEVLAFLVDDQVKWPEDQKEEFKLTQAMREGKATPEFFADVNKRVQKLQEFKAWLKKNTTIKSFNNPNDLETAVLHALQGWKDRHGDPSTHATATAKPKAPIIPPAYLDWCLNRCSTIELSTHLAKEGYKPPRLASVYVPAPTVNWKEIKRSDIDIADRSSSIQFLLDRFADESLYVPGIAGSGKSTFAKWVVYLLCCGAMPEQIQIDPSEPVVEQFPQHLNGKLPLLIPFRDFWPFLPHHPRQLELSRKEFETAMQHFVEQKLDNIIWDEVKVLINEGLCVLLFDGVDEIPISAGEQEQIYYPRQMMISGMAECFPHWQKQGNRLLLTSRPSGLTAADQERIGLVQSEIVDLTPKLVELFIYRWFTASDHGEAMAHSMIAHLSERDDLNQLTGNPVMLLAMCILYSEGKRLPQDKAELYHLTIERILFNRYQDSLKADGVYHRLSVIAYGMHTGEGLGEVRTTPRAECRQHEIDKMLQSYMEQLGYTEKGFTSVAEAREDMLSHSGLLMPRDEQNASFYHLSFQEYLAAKRMVQLAGDRLFDNIVKHADVSEWRNTLAFAFSRLLYLNHSPEKNIHILNRMMEQVRAGMWSRLVLLGDFLEIINAKGFLPDAQVTNTFKDVCLKAIEQQAPIRERFELGRVLGILGDPRIILDLRTPPQGYILVPQGRLKLGETGKQEEIKQPLYLSQYPVTNAQFRIFVEEEGYKNDQWWSKEGRQWRVKNSIAEPDFWRQGRWNLPNFPVVGVSWYEAEAFCSWAGGRLPSEAEWEWSAGRGSREYPWGNEAPTAEHANYGMNVGRTTPVGLYPPGATPDGLMDMAGNVLEWCADWSDEGKKYRVLRGGSFDDDSDWVRCSLRLWDYPDSRLSSVGFRVARVPVL